MARIATAAQREAARKNGARSRGPKTLEGKARCSANALRHGLFATRHLVLADEDPKALAALRAALCGEQKGQGALAEALAERLAISLWKLFRCDRLEVQLAAMPARPQRGWLEAEPGLPAVLSRLPERALLERIQGRLERFVLRAAALLMGSCAGRPRRRRRVVRGGALEPLGDDPPFSPPPPATETGCPGGARLAPDPFASPPSRPAPDPPSAAKAGCIGEQAAHGSVSACTPFEPGFAERAAPPAPTAPAAGGAARDPPPPEEWLERGLRTLLAQGRFEEAARLGARLARLAASAPACDEPDAEAIAATLTAEERAAWEALGYEQWVVPPGCGRMPLASLTAEWVTPADRWRVLEELHRLGDPQETARVLAHFERAGLDPGADHPAFARPEPNGTAPKPTTAPPAQREAAASEAFAGSAAAAAFEPAGAASPVPLGENAEEPGGADPQTRTWLARNPLLRKLIEDSATYHEESRIRTEARRWQEHARALDLPLPPQGEAAVARAAALTGEPGAAANTRSPEKGEPEPIRPPHPLLPLWWGQPRDPTTGKPLARCAPNRPNEPEPARADANSPHASTPSPATPPPGAADPAAFGPARLEPLPDPPSWPSAPQDEPEPLRASRNPHTPTPPPPAKTTPPTTPIATASWTPSRLGALAPAWRRGNARSGP